EDGIRDFHVTGVQTCALPIYIGQYPYEQYSVIQGGDGGMEYAMCTMITGEREFDSLFGVTAHELAHSWFQFVLAFNESKHGWMRSEERRVGKEGSTGCTGGRC